MSGKASAPRLATAVVALVLLAGMGGSAGAATSAVSVEDNTFNAETITVTAGDTVTWTDNGNNPHTVTADDASQFDSGPSCTFSNPGSCLAKGQTFSHTFTTAGTFPYYCRIHGAPGGAGMHGVIVVQAAPDVSQPTTPATITPAATGTATTVTPSSSGTTVAASSATTAAPTATAGATATVTTVGDGLPKTGGGSTPLLVMLGGFAVVGGAVALLVARRTRSAP